MSQDAERKGDTFPENIPVYLNLNLFIQVHEHERNGSCGIVNARASQNSCCMGDSPRGTPNQQSEKKVRICESNIHQPDGNLM